MRRRTRSSRFRAPPKRQRETRVSRVLTSPCLSCCLLARLHVPKDMRVRTACHLCQECFKNVTSQVIVDATARGSERWHTAKALLTGHSRRILRGGGRDATDDRDRGGTSGGSSGNSCRHARTGKRTIG